jgi:hypothetical protein
MKPKLILCLALVLSGNCDAAIIYPKAPDGGRQMVYEFASEILRTDPHFFKDLHLDDLVIADPYRSYFVGLTNLAAALLLSVAKSGSHSWQYLLIHGTNAGIAYLNADDKT